MKNYTYYSVPLVFISAILLFQACDEDLLYREISRTVVVNSFITPGDTFRINVSYTTNTHIPEKDSFINDATIKLHLPDQSMLSVPLDQSQYRYSNPFKGFYRLNNPLSPIPGPYTVIVQLPGGKTLHATDSLPAPVPIITFKLMEKNQKGYFDFLLGFNDPSFEKNYYSISANIFTYGTAIIFDGSGVLTEYKYRHRVFNAELSSESAYIEAALNGPSAQLVFSDQQWNNNSGENQILCHISHPQSMNADSIVFEIRLNALSFSAYRYLTSLYNQTRAEKDFYSEPVIVYSNVQGGLGIFGCSNPISVKACYTKGDIVY